MKTCFCRLPLAVLPWAMVGTLPALAQTGPVTQLPETVVTASRNSQLLGSALPHTTVITREDIERSQAVDLVTLLEREPGLQKIQNDGLGTTVNIFLRGSAALQTLVLIDGIAQNKQDASGAVRDAKTSKTILAGADFRFRRLKSDRPLGFRLNLVHAPSANIPAASAPRLALPA